MASSNTREATPYKNISYGILSYLYSILYLLRLAIYLEDTLNTTLTCIVLVSEKHCSMFNANKLLYCIVLYCNGSYLDTLRAASNESFNYFLNQNA